MAKKLFTKRTLALLLTLVMCFSSVQMAANAAPYDTGNWTYAYYLGQEYLGNAAGAAVKPDPVGYGFQGVITSITFTDDAGTQWTFNWSSEANGEWRITGRNASKEKASAWPQTTDGKVYVGYCGNKAYTFTLGNEGSSESWTYANTQSRHANWFRYIRFIREYTVNVFYENETGSVIFNGETFSEAEPVNGTFYFQYPNGGIIDDSEYEDGEYTVPTTLMPAEYLPESMILQGYEIKYATDAQGRDVLTSGVTISLLGENVLNVYCTLIPPATENYTVVHNYYMDGAFEGTQSGGTIEVTEGTPFADVVAGISKLTDYSGNAYEYISYEVDPADKVITLTYNRARPTYDYAVTYNANHGENPATASDSENVTGIHDTEYTVTVDACGFERENYFFAGWNTAPDGSGKDYDADEALTLTSENNSVTLYAQWQMKPKYDYIVTYNADFSANPATASDSENVNQTFKTSYTITIDANMFQRDHYDFLGWATESGGEVVYNSGMALNFTEGGSQELFAVWKEHAKYRYALSYNGNGGETPEGLNLLADEENAHSVYDTAYTMGVNTNEFRREHYTFIGWNTKPDGSGVSYAPGDAAQLTAKNNTLTLYAQWEEHPKHDYSVIYNANFGTDPSTVSDSQNISGTYAASHQVDVDANGFIRANYTFVGWNTQPNGTGDSYAPGDIVKLTASDNTKVLYAQWVENAKYDYSVTYSEGYGADPEIKADAQNAAQIYDEVYAIDVDENTFSRPNYTFVGWATEIGGQVVYSAGDTISFEYGGSEELFAVWIEHDKYSYTVIYNGNGGELPSGDKSYGDAENVADTYATSHSASVDSNTFKRDNYTFIGWNTSPDGSGKAYSAQDALNLTPNNNTLTLYAQWREHPKFDYTVIYNEGYGTSPATTADLENVTDTYETSKSISVDGNAFKRDNYTFIGWATEPGGEVVYQPGNQIRFTRGGSEELFAIWEENAKYDYRLTYEGNGGALLDDAASYDDAESVSQVYDTVHTLEVDGNYFVRAHYDFIGWNTKPDGSGVSYNPGNSYILTAEKNTGILYAQWKEHAKYDYSVIYNANFGVNPAIKADSENVTGVYNTAYTVITDINSFDRPNYTFVGWNTKPDGTGADYTYGAPISLTSVNNQVTLYAQWEENAKYDYTVTYNAGYGLFPATRSDSENAFQIYNETYTIEVDANTFVREHYDFIGWATEKGGKVTFLAGDTISFEKGGSEELFAVWAEHNKYTYTVIYNGNGGTLENGIKSYADAENVKDVYEKTHNVLVDANTFTRAHYDFIGWNTKPDGSGTSYTAEQALALTATNNSVTLYAQWEEHEKFDYSVIYNANFGLAPETKADAQNISGTYATSHRIDVDGNDFVRPNYTFIGWNTQANGKGTAYSANDALLLTAENSSLILYAQWVENAKYDYSVTYNEGYGLFPETLSDSENASRIYDETYAIEVDENTFTRKHYDFIGWATEKGGDVTFAPGDVISFEKGGSEELFAVWVEHDKYSYSVIYNGNGGTLAAGEKSYGDDENVTGVYDEAYTIGVDKNTFTREHYDFIGWNTKPDGSGISYSAAEAVQLTSSKNSLTLYAQWQEHDKYDYTVTYNEGYGTDPETVPDSENESGIYDPEKDITVDDNPFERENHDFIGWGTEPEGEVVYEPGDEIHLTEGGEEELYAIWVEHDKYDYSVTYNEGYGLFPEILSDSENVNQIYDETYTIEVDENTFTRKHYDFLGWATEKGGEIVFLAGDTISFEKGGSEELFAVWAEHNKYSYTVVYNGNGGQLASGEKSYGDDENVKDVYDKVYGMTVDGNTFLRDNHDFIGWNTEPDGTGTAYTAEQALELTAENSSLTLYAQWKEHPRYDYEVIYHPNNDDPTDPIPDSENETGTYDPEKTITVDDNPFPNDDDDFIGWSTEPDGEVVYKPGDEIDLTEGGEVDLYAQWEPKDREYTVEYLVKIDDNPYVPFDGEVPEGGILPHGTVVGKDIVNPPASITDGTYTYTFVEIKEIILDEGENVVRVYFQYITPPAPVDPIPEEPTPEEPVDPVDPTPADPTVEEPAEPASVDGDGLVELPDEDVPLAEAPKTGDPMLVYAGMTLFSGAGLAFLGLGKKKDEED